MNFIKDFPEIIKNKKHSSFEGLNEQEIFNKVNFSDKTLRPVRKDILAQLLFSEIKNTLSGEKIKQYDFQRYRDFFIFQYFLKEDTASERIFHYLEIIRDATREIKLFSGNIEDWERAIELTDAYITLDTYNPIKDKTHYYKGRAQAKAYRFMQKSKFNVSIEEGRFYFKEEENKKICMAIDHRLKRLGESGLSSIWGSLNKLYDPTTKRYYFKRFSENQMIPWGYLFKLSVKYLDKNKNKVKSKSIFNEAVSIAVNYATLLDIQEYSMFHGISQSSDSILDTIQDAVTNDQVYSISQLPSHSILELIEGIFSQVNNINLSWTLPNYLLTAKTILNNTQNNDKYIFSIESIRREIAYQISEDELKLILDSLSHKACNKSYLTPFDTSLCDYNFKPLFKQSNTYSIYSENFFNFGFYEVISSEFRKRGLKDDTVGTYLENFIETKLRSCNISVFSNEHYEIDKSLQKELGITRATGECDFIIETENTIFFMEAKKKILTREAQGGNVIKLTLDIVKSFLAAQIQANWHEIILKKKGSIKFKSGNELHLNNKEVEKISLSMFEFMSLHDPLLIQQIMQNFLGKQIAANDPDRYSADDINKINKALLELHKQYSSDEFDEYIKSNNPFFNCRFFNIFHFLEILNNVQSAEDFKREIWRTRHISTASKDWFRDSKYIKELYKNQNKT